MDKKFFLIEELEDGSINVSSQNIDLFKLIGILDFQKRKLFIDTINRNNKTDQSHKQNADAIISQTLSDMQKDQKG